MALWAPLGPAASKGISPKATDKTTARVRRLMMELYPSTTKLERSDEAAAEIVLLADNVMTALLESDVWMGRGD